MRRTLYVYEGQCDRHSWGGSPIWKLWIWCTLTRNQKRWRRRLRSRGTLAQTMLMWLDHVSVSLMVTPKNLKERTCSTWLPSTLSSKVLPVTFLLEWMSILFVFKVFNLKPFLWSHRFARLRQVWSEDWRLQVSSLTIKIVVSSAKRTVELRGRTEGRSLMKAENRVGPRIEPWGIPEEGNPGKK